MKPKPISISVSVAETGIMYAAVCDDGTMWCAWDSDERGFMGWGALPAIPHCEGGE